MNRNTLTYIILSLFIIFIIFLSLKDTRQYREIRKNGKSTVGQITTFGSDLIIKYDRNGQVKQKRMSQPYTTIYSG